MPKLTARAVQGTVQAIFYTSIAACIFLIPAIIEGAIFPAVTA